jgi:hypothetical protein
LTRNPAAAATQEDAGPNLLIPAGAIAGLAIGLLIIIALAWMVTAHIATKSRLKNTGKDIPVYEEGAIIEDIDAAGSLAAAAAATLGTSNGSKAAKRGIMDSPRAAAPAELIGTSADGAVTEVNDSQSAETRAALDAVAAATGFFLPMSHSLSETAYVGSLSGSGLQRTAARPGRPKAMAQEVRARRSTDLGRVSSSTPGGNPTHAKAT